MQFYGTKTCDNAFSRKKNQSYLMYNVHMYVVASKEDKYVYSYSKKKNLFICQATKGGGRRRKKRNLSRNFSRFKTIINLFKLNNISKLSGK